MKKNLFDHCAHIYCIMGDAALGWLIAALAFLFAAIVAIAAIIAGRAVVAFALLPAAVVFLAFHHAIKHTDKSWRCKESERKEL